MPTETEICSITLILLYLYLLKNRTLTDTTVIVKKLDKMSLLLNLSRVLLRSSSKGSGAVGARGKFVGMNDPRYKRQDPRWMSANMLRHSKPYFKMRKKGVRLEVGDCSYDREEMASLKILFEYDAF